MLTWFVLRILAGLVVCMRLLWLLLVVCGLIFVVCLGKCFCWLLRLGLGVYGECCWFDLLCLVALLPAVVCFL